MNINNNNRELRRLLRLEGQRQLTQSYSWLFFRNLYVQNLAVSISMATLYHQSTRTASLQMDCVDKDMPELWIALSIPEPLRYNSISRWGKQTKNNSHACTIIRSIIIAPYMCRQIHVLWVMCVGYVWVMCKWVMCISRRPFLLSWALFPWYSI